MASEASRNLVTSTVLVTPLVPPARLIAEKSDGGVGALKNIDYDHDFLVDREKSEDDETFFDVYIQPVDSSEKLYFTVTTH